MKTLIFADVHLEVGPSGEKTLREFTEFLRQIDPEEFECTVILGDLFDFWFEYKHVVFSAYFDVLRAFADLHERGMAFHLICGNHDFWAGKFLEQRLGFTIHRRHFAAIARIVRRQEPSARVGHALRKSHRPIRMQDSK